MQEDHSGHLLLLLLPAILVLIAGLFRRGALNPARALQALVLLTAISQIPPHLHIVAQAIGDTEMPLCCILAQANDPKNSICIDPVPGAAALVKAKSQSTQLQIQAEIPRIRSPPWA